MRKILLLGLLIGGLFNRTKAQIEITAGLGVCFPSKKNFNVRVSPTLLPTAGIYFNKTVTERISIRSGLLYQLKGLNYKRGNSFDSLTSFQVKITSQYHYLSIPLQLNISHQLPSKNNLRISFGMNYGFLISANTRETITSFYKQQQTDEISYTYKNFISAARSNDPGRLNDRTELYVFTPSVRVETAYEIRKNMFVTVFYEYNLNDVSINAGTTRVNLHGTGLMVNWVLSH